LAIAYGDTRVPSWPYEHIYWRSSYNKRNLELSAYLADSEGIIIQVPVRIRVMRREKPEIVLFCSIRAIELEAGDSAAEIGSCASQPQPHICPVSSRLGNRQIMTQPHSELRFLTTCTLQIL
jgi:hypothetical protein